MSVIVKICGLTTQAGLDAALAGGADMAGFVFLTESAPRLLGAGRKSRPAGGEPGVQGFGDGRC